MEASEPEPETELELTSDTAVQEMTRLFQMVGRVEATAIVTQAPDVLYPACDKAAAELNRFAGRVEGMPAISVDRYASSQKKAAAEAESQVRRGWLNQIQRLHLQVDQARDGPKGLDLTVAPSAVRVGRAVAGPHPTSAELVSTSAIRSLTSEPAEGGIVSFTGKVLTDPTLLTELANAVDANVQTLLSLSLSSCELSNEALDVLGPALQEHPSLKSLDLSDNRLSSAGAELLVAHVLAPEEPGKKRAAKKVSNTTQLESGDMIHLSWEATSRPQQQQEERPEAVEGLGLQALNLSDNPLGVNGSRAIGEALGLNTTLQTVAMRSVALGPRGASNLSRFGIEKNCGTLTTLDISRNKIGDAGAAALAASLKANPAAITSLDLTSNEVGQVGAASLAEVLGVVDSRLQKLNLGGNPITCVGAAALAAESGRAVAAGQRVPNGLCELLLANCELAPPISMKKRNVGEVGSKQQPRVGPTAMGAVDGAKQGHPEMLASIQEAEDVEAAGVYWSRFVNARSLIGRSVTCLHIKNNNLDSKMLVAMASAWNLHARSVTNEGSDLLRLSRLDLSGNPAIGDAGVVALASSIEVGAAPVLEWLSLAKLGFSRDGAKAIAVALRGGSNSIRQTPSLAKQVSERDIDSDSPGHPKPTPTLVNSRCCALKTLILNGNRVGIEGKSAIAEALSHQSCGLTDLQMSRMQWDCDGAALLASALEQNSKLVSLDLGGNALGLKGICALGWALSEHNHTLTSLQLWNNTGLSISGGGRGEELSDVQEVIQTINHTLDDNMRRAAVHKQQLDDDRVVALDRAREEQEVVAKRINANIDRSKVSPVGSVLNSEDEERSDKKTLEKGGELIWEGVRDGKML